MIRNSHSSLAVFVLRAVLVAGIAGGVLFGHVAVAEDKLSKFLLIKLSREQSQVLCTTEAFTSCMDFTKEVCLDLSEKALQQCIVPLPDTISLSDLENETLESCPQKVYLEAGYSEDKAVQCVNEILKQ